MAYTIGKLDWIRKISLCPKTTHNQYTAEKLCSSDDVCFRATAQETRVFSAFLARAVLSVGSKLVCLVNSTPIGNRERSVRFIFVRETLTICDILAQENRNVNMYQRESQEKFCHAQNAKATSSLSVSFLKGGYPFAHAGTIRTATLLFGSISYNSLPFVSIFTPPPDFFDGPSGNLAG